MEKSGEYFAFISYKREDENWAKWLQYKLEHYRIPIKVRKENPQLPQAIRPVFKDNSELAAGVLEEEIHEALVNSKYLIVICSPRAAQSKWVGKEVQAFIDMGRSEKIIPFIIGGTPYSIVPEEECFPMALLNLPKEQELLGVNINEMGRDVAAVKVVARMFNLKFDTLWQRHVRYERKKRIIIGTLISTLLIISIIVGYIFYSQRNSIRTNYTNLLSMQSRYVSKEAIGLFENNDATKALLLMRQLDSIPRPYVSESEYVLRTIFDKRIFLPSKGIKLSKAKDAIIQSISTSRNGKYIALAMNDSNVYILYTKNLKLKRKIVLKYNANGVSFCENDSKILISLYRGSGIYDVETGKEIVPLFQDEKDREILSAKYSYDYKTLGLLIDKECEIWDPNTMKRLSTISIPNKKIKTIGLNPNGQQIALGLKDSSLIVWDIPSKKEVLNIKKHRHVISSVSYSVDGKWLLTSSWDHTARIWDSQTGEQIALLKHNCFISDASFSADGKFVLTSDVSGITKVWETTSFYNILNIDGTSNRKIIWNSALGLMGSFSLFLPNENTIVTGSPVEDEDVRIWSVNNPYSMKVLRCAEKDVNYAFYTNDNNKLITCSESELCIRDAQSHNVIKKFKIANNERFYYTKISPNGKQLAVLSDCYHGNEGKYKIQLINMSNFKIDCQILINNDFNKTFDFSFDSRYVSIGSYNGDIMFWDTSTGEEIHNKQIHIDKEIWSLSFSNDGKYIAIGSRDSTITVFDCDSNDKWELLTNKSGVTSIAFSSDSKILYAYDGNITSFSLDSKRRIGRFDSMDPRHISIDPKGRYVIALSDTYDTEYNQWGRLIYTFDYKGNKTGSITIKTGEIGIGGRKIIKGVCYSPNGDEIIVSMSDGNVLFAKFSSISHINSISKLLLKNFKLSDDEKRNFYLE